MNRAIDRRLERLEDARRTRQRPRGDTGALMLKLDQLAAAMDQRTPAAAALAGHIPTGRAALVGMAEQLRADCGEARPETYPKVGGYTSAPLAIRMLDLAEILLLDYQNEG